MGTAVLDGQASSARSASQTLQSRQAHSVLSPVFRRSIAGSAPGTPSAAVQMEGCKRAKKAATEDDHGESTVSSWTSVRSQAVMWVLVIHNDAQYPHAMTDTLHLPHRQLGRQFKREGTPPV